MRLRILSDLHREFGVVSIPKDDADLIILAGDIATKSNGLPWMRDFCGTTPAAFVCGNHEFYGDKLPRARERLAEAAKGTNIHVLENEYFMIGGWHVYGCTLWTDLSLHGDWREGQVITGSGMNDYKRIRNSARGYKRLSPQDTRLIHMRSLMEMAAFFADHDPARTIVVTHHAPSIRSLPHDRRDDPMSCAYASCLDEFILTHQPHLWVHGHIHNSNDYHIGQTRIISNPMGYPDGPNPDFQPLLRIDI